MSIKNMTSNIAFFDGATINENSSEKVDLYGVNKNKPSAVAKRISNDTLLIDKMDILFSICGIEKIENKIPYHPKGENPSNIFFSNSKYMITLRVTETYSGKFFDLDTFEINPDEHTVTLCGNIYNQTFMFHYQNVAVAIPPEGKNLCVLKVLIKPATNEDDPWQVQSMYPIRLIF